MLVIFHRSYWNFFLMFLLLSLSFMKWEMFINYEIFNFFNMAWLVTFQLDFWSYCFGSVVLLISSLIFTYSLSYMHDEKEKKMFFIVLFTFTLSMEILIFSFSFSSLMLGWDGLGVTSFILIIYYHSKKSLNSSLITMYTNRLGDCLMMFAIIFMIDWMTWVPNFQFNNQNYMIIMLIMLAACTKSAQMPFSFWLPKAMAAPTPVSSLVHSSTLVTAGVYILFRTMDNLISKSESYILIISFSTLMIGSLMALGSFDLKEVIAFSTMSQIGLMIFTLSMGMKSLAYFHLLTHALFKSVLFLAGGLLIHLMHTQDIRLMGLFNSPPILMMGFTVSILSMIGMIYLSGFYSKDLVLDSLSMKYESIKVTVVILTMVSLSSLYSFRLLFYMMSSSMNYSKSWDNDWMIKSMFFLLLFSSFFGGVFQWNLMIFNYHLSSMKNVIITILIFSFALSWWMKSNTFTYLEFLSIINFNLNNLLKWGSFYNLLTEKLWMNYPYSMVKNLFMLSINLSHLWMKLIFFLFILFILLFI